MLTIQPHPLFAPRVIVTKFPKPIGELETSRQILELMALSAMAPISIDETVKPKVRDLLRHGGYKPTGRGKPASEYLRQAVEKGALGPINLPVDVCNVVSLHSGLPISVVDLDLVQQPADIRIAPADSEYVFNATGQTIKIDGLLCLFDAEGACANGVKDSQRTKTTPSTTRTLSVIWGTNELANRTEQAAAWYGELLGSCGASTEVLQV